MKPIRAFKDLSLGEEEVLKEEVREQSKNDLHYLAKHVLGYDRLTEHIHKQMAIDVDSPDYKFKVLLWPRSHFKSTIATESYSIQSLLRDPTERILITNAKLENSRKFLRAIQRHFAGNQRLRWAWLEWWIAQYLPEFERNIQKDKDIDWITRSTVDELVLIRPGQGREASITTGSTDANLVSQHYSKIIADDLINRDYVRTPEMIEKSILYFKDLLDLLTPDGEFLLIGTRWSHADLYSWIIEEFSGIASLRVPENYISDEAWERSKEKKEEEKTWMISVMPTSPEKPIFPEEYGKEALDALLHAKGPYEFSAQYLLDPTPDEHQKFKEEWFNRYDTELDTSDLTICITVDPAASLKDRADRSAITVCGYDRENRMYFLDGLDDRVTEDELLEILYDFALYYDRAGRFLLPIGFEAIGFQQAYVYNLDRLMRERGKTFPVEPVRRRQASKEERILRLVPRLKSEFYIPRKLKKFSKREGEYDLIHRLMWQLLKFPFAGKDDLIDALADQLDIVQATKFPGAKPKSSDGKVVDFVHPSKIEDARNYKKKRVKRYVQNVGAVK